MVVDIDLFQANIRHMAETVKENGVAVRPHVKVHKSVDVAKHQVAQGAIGLTCATIAEAELFSGAGIKGVLWTKQPASVNNIQRAVLLSKKDPTFMFVTDSPKVVDWVEEAAAAHNAKVRIAVSVFAGMARQGIDGGQPRSNWPRKSRRPNACSSKDSWRIRERQRTPKDLRTGASARWKFWPVRARAVSWP
jgi:D-serine deaminase-like pyridoxal phosphate-dependent protein